MTSKSRLLRATAATLLLAGASELGATEFRFIAWGNCDENLRFTSGTKATELSVPDEAFSPSYTYTGAGPLILYKLVEGDPKPVKKVACTLPIPESMARCLVILIPPANATPSSDKVLPNSLGIVSPNVPMTYDHMLVDDSPESRPRGTIEFRNFTGLPLALQLEKQQFNLPADPHAKHQALLVTGAKRLFYRAAVQVNGKWEIIGSNPLSTRGPPDRMMVIFKPNAAGPAQAGAGGIRTLVIADWTRPDPAANTLAQGTPP